MKEPGRGDKELLSRYLVCVVCVVCVCVCVCGRGEVFDWIG